jgi:very-short-patch-repair endonuclease
MSDETLRPDERPHPNPSPEGEGLKGRKKQTTLLDFAVITDSPPLQGRGRGWGLSAQRNAEIASHARTMRNQPTEPEIRLWSVLRGRQLGGFKFRRQEKIGSAIADFFCPQKGLVVEVDGDTHADPATDVRRTARLEALGLRVVRVTNFDVMGNIEGVHRHLLDILEAMPDRRAPHPKPSPEGEGLKQVEAQQLLGSSLEGSVG